LGQWLNSEPKEWAARCRKCAAEALFSAENSLVPEIAAGHLKLAAGWHALAVEIERALDLETSDFWGRRGDLRTSKWDAVRNKLGR
jgi:hypothetical protein